MVPAPPRDGRKVHRKSRKSVSETCSYLVGLHILVCPFVSDPRILVFYSLEMKCTS